MTSLFAPSLLPVGNLAVDHKVAAVSDDIKPEAKDIVAQLQRGAYPRCGGLARLKGCFQHISGIVRRL